MQPVDLAWAFLFVVAFGVVYRFFAWLGRRFGQRPPEKVPVQSPETSAITDKASVSAPSVAAPADPETPTPKPAASVAPVPPRAVTVASPVPPPAQPASMPEPAPAPSAPLANVPRPAPASQYATAKPTPMAGVETPAQIIASSAKSGGSSAVMSARAAAAAAAAIAMRSSPSRTTLAPSVAATLAPRQAVAQDKDSTDGLRYFPAPAAFPAGISAASAEPAQTPQAPASEASTDPTDGLRFFPTAAAPIASSAIPLASAPAASIVPAPTAPEDVASLVDAKDPTDGLRFFPPAAVSSTIIMEPASSSLSAPPSDGMSSTASAVFTDASYATPKRASLLRARRIGAEIPRLDIRLKETRNRKPLSQEKAGRKAPELTGTKELKVLVEKTGSKKAPTGRRIGRKVEPENMLASAKAQTRIVGVPQRSPRVLSPTSP